MKSKSRFDNDVAALFKFRQQGKVQQIDAPLAMELITQAAFTTTAPIKSILDIGCGAGKQHPQTA